MADEMQILKNRFKELHSRSANRGIYLYSDFLNLHEQTILFEQLKFGYTLFGGFDDSERKIAIFGNEDDFGYAPQPPVTIICVRPLSEKFSDELTHRDFLGSVLALGIKRETVGDIIINKNCGYVICLDSIAPFIIDNLIKVRHTSVSCEICESLPDDALPEPEESIIIVSSLRLDVIISGVYNISRSKSSALIDGEKVFINGKLSKSTSVNLQTDDMISVRGFGRFRYKDTLGDTRKGRLRIKCEIY